MTIDGEVLDAGATYKVAVPSFLAAGGDNFHAFNDGTAVDTGLVDYEAWIEYLGQHDPVSPDFARRSLDVEGLQATYPAGGEVSFSLPKLDLTSTGSPHNTSVAVELLQGETRTDLGDFDVTDGAATPTFTLPEAVSGDAAIRITAAPSGTTADLPVTIEAAEGSEATVDAITLPFIEEGSYAYVGVRVTGPDGRPTGTVTVREGDTKLGSAPLYRGYTLVVADTRQLERGRHTITVDYSGDDAYEPASDEVSIRVKRSN